MIVYHFFRLPEGTPVVNSFVDGRLVDLNLGVRTDLVEHAFDWGHGTTPGALHLAWVILNAVVGRSRADRLFRQFATEILADELDFAFDLTSHGVNAWACAIERR